MSIYLQHRCIQLVSKKYVFLKKMQLITERMILSKKNPIKENR